MEYKLFTEFTTLQALLKEVGIIQSGGAIKSFLSENIVLFNGEDEKRRGKKIRIGDEIEIPEQGVKIRLVEPSESEKEIYLSDQAEKVRVAKLVKELNKSTKKQVSSSHTKAKKSNKPVRFPGM